MRVFFFPKGDAGVASSRYRCFFFAEALRAEGIEAHVSAPPLRMGLRPRRGALADLRRLDRELRRAGRGDVVYLQRPIQSTPFVALAALHVLLFRRRMVFDFCDPIFVHSPGKTALLTRLADAVVVSCEDLAVWARRRNPAVHVIPNSVKAEQVRRAADPGTAPAEGRPPVVGWVGGAAWHRDNLRLLLEVFARIERPFTFRLIGTRGAGGLVAEFRAVLGDRLEAVDWLAPERVGEAIAGFDVAVLPVTDAPFNRKLLTKLLEYFAAGVPVVASPVGDNRFAIADGANGLLATGADEWAAKLDALLADPALRRRLGAAGRATVLERFSLAVNGPRLARLLAAVAAGTEPGLRSAQPAPPR